MKNLMEKLKSGKVRIGIIGLGYVGLPLAVEFGKIFDVVGFDVKYHRIKELLEGVDRTLECSADDIKSASKLSFSADIEDLRNCDIFIVTVPTPVDKYTNPDLTPLHRASETVGKVISRGRAVIYESTVYPGCTEEECVPVIEKFSGLVFNRDFYCGYSPERINPGDKVHRVQNIKKITSGSTPDTADVVDALYSTIVKAGTHKASSLKVAEAAKVIENSQRDINIAFMNELSKIFRLIGIDTTEVLEAAGTKWNFLPFRPGLVGGHCIGVDPYYLTHKAESLGYHPEIILAGRRLNDGMGGYVAAQVVKLMIRKGLQVNNSKVLVLGMTFKENCSDIRNSRVIDLIRELQSFGCLVDVSDPCADPSEVEREYNVPVKHFKHLNAATAAKYDAVVLAVAHDAFKGIDYSMFDRSRVVIYDVKSMLPKELVDGRL